MELLHDEPARLEAVRSLEILDSSQEAEFNDIATMASDLCGAPMSAICIVDEARVWVKACQGLAVNQFPRESSFCELAIQSDHILTVPDAAADPRFQAHPMVRHAPLVRFYAGVPIKLSSGFRVGTLSVFDVVPRALQDFQIRILETLARQCARLMEYRAMNLQRQPSLPAGNLSVLGELTAGVAHEITNPLEVIVARAEKLVNLARNNHCPPEVVELNALGIERTGLRIGEIVRSVLAIARDREPIVQKVISANELLQALLEQCQTRLKEHDIQLKLSAPHSLAFRCPALQVSQALFNLVSNAIDAVADLPERWIAIEFSPTEKGIEIVVTDSGFGLPPKVQQNLMKPFFTTKAQGKGTGLGLLVSQKLLEAQGGKLTYDSSFPRTRFRIQLPI